MNETERFLSDTRIASPCRANWDDMKGDEKARFCGECNLHVYNISNMVASEAAALIERSDGRICVRLYRRHDGTIITQDCPVGLRAAVRRASIAAGTALTAVLSLFAGVGTALARSSQDTGDTNQATTCEPKQEEPHVLMGKIAIRRGERVTVNLVDKQGHAVENAHIALTNLGSGDVFELESVEAGRYELPDTEPGVYTLSVSADGFDVPLPRTLRVRRGKPVSLKMTLVGAPVKTMGMVALPRRDM